jgi:clathrin heavy chain
VRASVAMAAVSPIRLDEVLSLPSIGVDPSALTFATCTMESDAAICVREPNGLTIVNLANPAQPIKRPVTADSALRCPSSSLIALKAGVQLQLFDLDAKTKLKSFVMSDTVVFWKWISARTIGIVTAASVYHWRADDATSEPVKMFDRHDSLASSQIINYRSDVSEEWLVLVGISAQEGGRVGGNLQLYSVTKKISQAIEGHAATFAMLNLDGHPTTLFVFASKTAAGVSRLHVIEVGADKKPAGAPKFEKKLEDIYYPPEMPNDFPVALQMSSKYSIAFLVTKMGYVHLYDVESGQALYMNRISETTVFATTPNTSNGGLLGVNRQGRVLSVSLREEQIVPYVMSKLNNVELATRLASRNGFPGAERLFTEHFLELFDEGKYRDAALVAADSPAGSLRGPETIARFKQAPADESGRSPLLTYFQALLERGKLNKLEAIELAMQVAAKNSVNLLEKWLVEDKLECSTELGDLILPTHSNLALAVYIKAKAHPKVIQALIQMGQVNKVAPYAQKVGMQLNATELVQMASQFSPEAALQLANALQQAGVGAGGQLVPAHMATDSSGIDHEAMFDTFMNRGMLQEATSYCLDNLKSDREQDGPLQTKVLEANLMNAPQVADVILQQDLWHHFDKPKIAMLCERAGLFQHALEHYTDLEDVKRVMQNTHVINPEFLAAYFGNLTPDDRFDCLEVLINSNPRGNLELCVIVAAKHTEDIGLTRLMDLFAGLKQQDALFFYLQAIVNESHDPEVHFKFIEASCAVGQFGEAERVTRESSVYDPERVKIFLMETRPRDPRPLINVCDRFGFVEEMVTFMVKNKQIKFVEGYVQRVNPLKCPQVVGALMDLDYDEDFVKKLVMSVKNTVPVEELVDEVEKRNRLKLLLQFLEARVGDGATDVGVHSGIAKVYVESNINPEHFLETNAYYDSRDVGRFCEKRDPYLAFVAYKRGNCDEELLEVTNKHALFKDQARYLVDRCSAELYEQVLAEDNVHRPLIVEQIISTALPETREPNKISGSVKAFMAANMPDKLMEMLEKLVLQTSNSTFARNTNLQNLLLLTAIKADQPRVMEYVRRLDNYDGADIAQVAVGEQLFEEAFAIHQKFEEHVDAVGILLDHMQDFDRAEEYALKVDQGPVWSRLGVSQLEDGRMAAGVNSLIKAKDPAPYKKVIEAASAGGGKPEDFELVVKFLKFVRNKVKDMKAVDTEIVFALCKCNKLTEVEEFISQPHGADLEEVGERCAEDELYPAAKLLFSAVSNYGKLAPVLVRLGEFQGAVEAARKADRVRTWRAVCFACVDSNEFRLAQICGLHVVVEADELMETIDYYQDRGHFQHIIDLLEQGLTLDRAHTTMFTELGVLLSKYRSEAFMDHCKMWWQRCNIPRLIRASEAAMLWSEMVYLHTQYNEFDNAALVMMQHSVTAWSASGFTSVITKAGNLEVMYKAIQFYVDEQPALLNDLLTVLAPKVEASRAISVLRRACNDKFGELGLLPLCKLYLVKIQDANVPEVNSALNEVLIAEEAVEELQTSIESYDNFDQFALGRRLEKHKMLEFRRLASSLFRRNGKYEQAIELSKKDKMYKDAIAAVAASTDPELTEELATFFLENNIGECFVAILYTCFEFFRPDLALELSWRYNVMDHAMPFMIQTMKEIGQRLMGLEDESKEKREKEALIQDKQDEEITDDPSVLLFGLNPSQAQNAGVPMLMAPPAVASGMSGMGGMGDPQVARIGWGQ